MTFKPWLLASASLGLVASLAVTDAADAATKHKKKPAGPSLQTQVDDLRAQVESLQQTVLAQAQAAQAAQAQTNALQGQLADSQAKASAAQAQVANLQAKVDNEIQTIPGVINTQITKSIPKPKPSWADNTSVNGRMYADLTNIEQKRDGTKIAPSGTGFDIKRFYVGVDHKFDDTWSANVTTDVTYVSADSLTQVYIKKAYLQGKYNDQLTVRFGAADMPWIPFVEDIYGYRFVEQTLIDRTKFGTSADWGVHALGKLGVVSYQFSIVDGQGYKNPVRTKTMDFEGRVSANIDKFVFGVGGYSGKLGKEVTAGAPTFHDATRWDAIAAYVDPRFRVGVEYYNANNWNNVAVAGQDKADGYSVFGSVNFMDHFSFFTKYEDVKPSKTLHPTEKDNYYNLGLNWEPVKIVDIALVYKHDKVENGSLSTGNGTIGGVNSGVYDEFGIFTQLRW
jgi:hypothetical protein